MGRVRRQSTALEKCSVDASVLIKNEDAVRQPGAIIPLARVASYLRASAR